MLRLSSHALQQTVWRATHPAWLGTLRRTEPLSQTWGYERGTPIDRYYISCFLVEYRSDIYGRVLEVKDNQYTRMVGAATRSDVLDIDPCNPRATIVTDLAEADAIPSNTFDCFILTQTLQYIYDVRAAIAHARRVLRPNGVLLVTVPVVSRVIPGAFGHDDFWRFTPASCTSLFGEIFGPDWVTVRSYGNVLTSIAFLSGLASQDLSRHELDITDPRFPVIAAVRAVKPELSG